MEFLHRCHLCDVVISTTFVSGAFSLTMTIMIAHYHSFFQIRREYGLLAGRLKE